MSGPNCCPSPRVLSSAFDLNFLARRRLLAIDLGARYIGLAARTSLHHGPFPCGFIERVTQRHRHGLSQQQQLAANNDWEWSLRREEKPGRVTRHATQADAIATALAEHEADVAVVGMPYHADGSRSRECAIVERQVEQMQLAWPRPVPVLFWDESFSTRRVVGQRRPPPGSKAARGSHALAACLILEEVLDALAPLEEGEPEPGM